MQPLLDDAEILMLSFAIVLRSLEFPYNLKMNKNMGEPLVLVEHIELVNIPVGKATNSSLKFSSLFNSPLRSKSALWRTVISFGFRIFFNSSSTFNDQTQHN